MNDTTRQVGGALGVAILGSITNAAYQSSISGAAAVKALPSPVRAAVHDSVGGALTAAKAMAAGPASSVATQVSSLADHAFVHAMSSTLVIASGIALLGALVAFLFLPARAAEELAPVLDLDVERRHHTEHGTWLRPAEGPWVLVRDADEALAG
ncbi:MAG: hypothetical protein JO148_11285 [Acidimicrobiia bacterium]|nr:hypothetical protein [Acidimicrobiia bacterium]